MGKRVRTFVPFGELMPDGKHFNSRGLLEALNVVPVYGSYITASLWSPKGSNLASTPFGLHLHPTAGNSWRGYTGTATALYEISTAFGQTDKTRLVGGAYGAPASDSGWQGASFGESVIMTNYTDDVQLLPSPASANFEKLAQSGGANPGMDPKAKFAFPIKNNLFLANLNLSAAFDGLPSGANPTAIAWSQTDVPRRFGSFNATPELVGAGYQPLNFDLGYIVGGIGGQYGMVALQQGWVRIDGPPYSFEPFCDGISCRFPNSIGRLGNDIFFWGSSGLCRFRDGLQIEVLGADKIARTILDNETGFSNNYSINSSVNVLHVNFGRDVVNRLVFFSFTSTAMWTNGSFSKFGDLCVIYNVDEDRFSFIENRSNVTIPPNAGGVVFMRTRPESSSDWCPGRDLIALTTKSSTSDGTGANAYEISIPVYQAAGSDAIVNPFLQTAFIQLDYNFTTRITRARPVYFPGSPALDRPQVTLSVQSKNEPYVAASSAASSTSRDGHGFVTIPDTFFADFHSLGIELGGFSVETVNEIEGVEIEYEIGPPYAAAS